ncbi:hypothetical protein [Aquimarina sp. RZ0]|uniref:hypothetical protein n=1 Tax=Aquimarina sp. RZ0 TaxID=2607730 RepID=UPI0011F1E583|nr:hypothetical protein [Aquimarina sp. RZ0]KAA1244535.1 hypothetical protein F0000_16245 [Aquimarina sp. RZ0]
MKVNTERLYLVKKPYPELLDFREIFVDAEFNLRDLEELFSRGFGSESLFGIYTNRETALKDAEMLWRDFVRQKKCIPINTEKNAFGNL